MAVFNLYKSKRSLTETACDNQQSQRHLNHPQQRRRDISTKQQQKRTSLFRDRRRRSSDESNSATTADQRQGRGRKQRSLLERPEGDMTGVFLSTRALSLTPPVSTAAQLGRTPLQSLPSTPSTVSSNISSSTSSSSSSQSCINETCQLMNTAMIIEKPVTETVETGKVTWKSSGAREHHKNSPLVVVDPESSVELIDEAETLGQIMARSRKLPGTWYYQCNHIMVNQERIRRTVAPLVRLRELDELARLHAEEMAKEETVFQVDPRALTAAFKRPARRLGANVAHGDSIREMHRAMMATASQKNNILDRRFTHMGMATARGKDGTLYLCQMFRG